MSTALTDEWLHQWSADLVTAAGAASVRPADAAVDDLWAATRICSDDLRTYYRHIGEVTYTTRGGTKKYYDFSYVTESVEEFLALVLESARRPG
ncbi:hypothetical protein [Nocardia sp. SSK8]|uniref:hypothetical protein n=1 Tax=Nocardia sp. SSK8 TaxID=3120154 RepID=UPI0030090FDF